MATPPPQNPMTTTVATIPKKPQPLPWSHQETHHLILAYQEKWYSLKRGQLKASQWEEVAVTVAARCGYDDPSKTSTQCRHKIEKLRKRYRSEKQRLGSSSYWPFFDLMDRMDRGPLPISALPIAAVHGGPGDDEDDDGDDDDDNSIEHEIHQNYMNKKSRSINHILNNGCGGRRKVVGEEEVAEAEEEEEEEEEERGEAILQLAKEMRVFAERFVKMENVKLEMMKESERFRIEMEDKRMEMIIQSHRNMVDTIGRALGSSSSHKKFKMTHDI